MRRVMYLFLPDWPIDRRRRSRGMPNRRSGISADTAPFATVIETGGRRLLAAVNPLAAAAGLAPGMPLADALSFLPGLVTAPAEPAADAAALTRLAEWCGRYSPWTAPDGADGVKIEITGSAHLWGGEAALAADLARRLSRQGIAHRIAIAGTLGAAWALARFAAGEGRPALPASEEERAALAPLPVEALRLDPLTAAGLRRVGLRHVGELYPMPRDALARRFGDGVARRLDQAFGDMSEPLAPLGETPSRRVRLSFAEPIADPADLACAIERLVADLVPRLAREGVGARRLDLAFHRIDGQVEHISLGTARPNRDPRHLAGLLSSKLDTIDPGLGIEDMILAVFTVEPLPAEQIASPLPTAAGAPDLPPPEGGGGGLAPLLDRLGNRFGLDALSRLEPRASHIPEKASIHVPIEGKQSSNSSVIPGRPGASKMRHPTGARTRAPIGAASPEPMNADGSSLGTVAGAPSAKAVFMDPGLAGSRPRPGMTMRKPEDGSRKPPRPVRLFQPPEPVEAYWVLPDDPPFRFVWRRRRHRVLRADGPERIAEEWWTETGSAAADAIRDYYRVEDEAGRRFWLFRAGLPGDPPPRWFLHGVFA